MTDDLERMMRAAIEADALDERLLAFLQKLGDSKSSSSSPDCFVITPADSSQSPLVVKGTNDGLVDVGALRRYPVIQGTGCSYQGHQVIRGVYDLPPHNWEN